MNKKEIFLIFFSAVCISLIVINLFYWYVEQMTEQKFQLYVEKLESKGITVEEKSLQGFHDQEIYTSIFWNDFGMEIEILQVDHVYYDRGKRILYFIRSTPKSRN